MRDHTMHTEITTPHDRQRAEHIAREIARLKADVLSARLRLLTGFNFN